MYCIYNWIHLLGPDVQLMCPHNIFDPLGHHAVTCKFGGDVVSRHNQLRDTFVQTCRIAGVSASIEAGSGLGHEHLHTRPADVLLPNWICSTPAALDFTVVSPLGSSHIVEGEERKHINNDQKCTKSSTVYVSQWLWRYMRLSVCCQDWPPDFL